MKTNQIIQHGEVMLIPLQKGEKVPNGTKSAHKEYIVAHSETGHHHVLKAKDNFEVVMDKLEMYLVLNREANLVHEKTIDVHPTKTVQPGKYRVIFKTEYSPASEIVARVHD